ncbi:hypothetical protein F5Y14DRAFT_401268 [Nemania sp. NC0429]|nr:hypothetical protein F5Y14DRAFT_401268 [Nemania sp. NC0429]
MALSQIHFKWNPNPPPPPNSFKGQAAVVTGGTGGLGLASAIHLVNLGADEVIITSRDPSRANKALETLEKETGGRSKGVVRILPLNMNSYTSVVGLVEEVKKIRPGKGGVDFVLLNAGCVAVEYKAVDEGWDQMVQVNVLSTALIGLLLLPWLKAERVNRPSPSHITIVGSGTHTAINPRTWDGYITKEGGVLAHFREPKNWSGSDGMYGSTKLMAHYAAAELAKLAKGPDNRPKVIINTTCPGVVRTELARDFTANSRLMAIGVSIFYALQGKTPEQGARTLMAAGMTKENENGKFIKFYGSEADYKKPLEALFTSERGSRIQASVWSEITGELSAKVPAAATALRELA